MPDFLLEIGVEEIPSRMAATAEAELLERVRALLGRERLLTSGMEARSYSTPRRLAVYCSGVETRQPDTEETMLGPAAKIAFKDGAPAPAALAFARKAGVAPGELRTISTAKGEYVAAVLQKPGRAAVEVLAELLPAEIAGLYWAKSMYWRPGKPERFVRPVRWMVALLGEEVLPVTFAGVTAGRESRGHRILHGDSPVKVNAAAEYATAMRSASVEPEPGKRLNIIRKALDAATRAVPGARWLEDAALLETVLHLTEWPSVILGTFEAEHLALPEEVLVTVMRDHQKYFAVEDGDGKLLPHFLAVLNTVSDSAGEETIRHGNARVLRARFNDARFFWDTDQKTPLAQRLAMLRSVTFQKTLGSYADKTEANVRLAAAICNALVTLGVKVDCEAVAVAATLAKADLTTDLVKEFTELQGIVGGLYARAQGVGEAAADAIYSQYMPAGNDGGVPVPLESGVLGVADRMSTIVDMFAIGLAPTGSKDPFALRRAASSVVRIVAAQHWPLALKDVVALAVTSSKQPGAPAVQPQVEQFLRERVAFYLRDVQGAAYDVVQAVLASGWDDVADAEARATAVSAVRSDADFAAIASAFKRTRNILAQAVTKGEGSGAVLDESLLTPGAEQELYLACKRVAPEVEALRGQQQYAEALQRMASLRPAVDAFFDSVMVMAPDAALRANRLSLLGGLLADFSRIADFAEVVPAS